MTLPAIERFDLISGAAVAPPVSNRRAQRARCKAALPRALRGSTAGAGKEAEAVQVSRWSDLWWALSGLPFCEVME